MNDLTKTRFVLSLQHEYSSDVDFTYDVEEGEESRDTSLGLDKDVWEEMGKPTIITVTVEPGDKLNEVKNQQEGTQVLD